MRIGIGWMVAASLLTPQLRAQTPSLPLGQVVEQVACQANAAETYALYLPSNYDPARTWPVIYAIEPGARGPVPVARFQRAAETYGYIVAGSNNARNGPIEPNLRSVTAMVNDTRQRLAVDRKRIYLTGFSGGARAASVFAQAWPATVAGIIACGAGLSEGMKPKELASTYFLGIVGSSDFNYLEMRTLERQMLKDKVDHRLIVTEGRHAWPTEDTCLRAVEWMELHAMTSGTRPKAPDLVEAIHRKELEFGRSMEERNDLTGAVFAYQQIAPLLGGLRGSDEIEGQIRRLSASEEFRRQAKKEEGRERRETGLDATFQRSFATIANAPLADVDLGQILTDIEVSDLQKDVRKTATLPEAQMAARLLTTLTIKADSTGWQYLDRGDARRANLFFEVGLKANEHNPSAQGYFLFSLGCAQGAVGSTKRALSYLRQAVEKGFDNRAEFAEQKCLEGLRQTPEFGAILKSLPDPKTK